MAQLVIIDYGAGNLRSVERAVRYAVEQGGQPIKVLVSDKPEDIAAADRLILPGVGAFGACRQALAERDGVEQALEEHVFDKKRPFLGICVGMQLLADQGVEHGVHQGLGWISGQVEAIPEQAGLKVPHMGWNEVRLTEAAQRHPLFLGMGAAFDAYFVHSYHHVLKDRSQLYGQVDYGQPLAAVIGRDNIVGMQFHPEKSQQAGLKLLDNFINWDV